MSNPDPDFPMTPREALEMRLTALLMGELPAEEAAALEAQIAADPQLATLHGRLRAALELLREASTLPEPAIASPEPIRLSNDRRERLLAHFKTEVDAEAGQSPAPITLLRNKRDWWWVPMSLAAAVVVMMGISVTGLRQNKIVMESPDFEGEAMSTLSTSTALSEHPPHFPASSPAHVPKLPTMESPQSLPTVTVKSGSGTNAPNPSPSTSNGPTPRPVEERAKQLMTEAKGFYETGRFEMAEKRSQQALDIDRSSLEARDLERKINDEVRKSGVAAYNETRSNGIKEVDLAWQRPIRRFNDNGSESPEGATADTSRARSAAKDGTNPAAAGGSIQLDGVSIRGQAEPQPAPMAAIPLAAGSTTFSGTISGAGPTKDIPVLGSLETSGGGTNTGQLTINGGASLTLSGTNTYTGGTIINGGKSEGLVVPNASQVAEMPKSMLEKNAPLVAAPAAPAAEAAVPAEPEAPMQHINIAGNSRTKDKVIRDSVAPAAKPAPQRNELVAKLEKQMPDNRVDFKKADAADADAPVKMQPATPPAVPQPEVSTNANPFSTFSLNVSDVGFKLAAASLAQGRMPDPATVRSEEFLNAFNYHDPEPAGGAPLAFASEQARYPFAQNRDLLRLSVKTAAAGRQPGRPLNLVLLIDNSGSMERADRVGILREALRVLGNQLEPQDKVSVVTFARTPRLWASGVSGDQAKAAMVRALEVPPQGGTNLEAALGLAYETARKHYAVGSISRVVLITDGAANLGDVNPERLKTMVETERRLGIALDCFGIGWEGYDDTVLETLSRNGDGRYGFINSPEEAATGFAGQLAGALRVAASDVKVQVEFNPKRVTAYRQIGYAKHQLTKEQFRDNTVDAAELGAAESGNALYVVEVNPRGEGDLATVRVRFKVPGTEDYREHAWPVPFVSGNHVPALDQASPSMRLAGAAAAFAEWLVGSPYAQEVTTDRLLGLLNGLPTVYRPDPRPRDLEMMIRQAKNVSGR